MKSRFLNSLGGISTNPENKIDMRFSIEYAGKTYDTAWAKIIRVKGRASYDIQLLDKSEVIESVATIGIPTSFYPLGKEVLIAFSGGKKYRPLIVGPVYGTGFGSSNPVSPDDNIGTSVASFQKIFESVPFITSDNMNDTEPVSALGTDIVNLKLPSAKVHKDLTAAESHEPKMHNHSDDHNGGGNLAMLSLQIPIMADSEAQNNTLYFSTDGHKLVYKDAIGSVYSLY